MLALQPIAYLSRCAGRRGDRASAWMDDSAASSRSRRHRASGWARPEARGGEFVPVSHRPLEVGQRPVVLGPASGARRPKPGATLLWPGRVARGASRRERWRRGTRGGCLPGRGGDLGLIAIAWRMVFVCCPAAHRRDTSRAPDDAPRGPARRLRRRLRDRRLADRIMTRPRRDACGPGTARALPASRRRRTPLRACSHIVPEERCSSALAPRPRGLWGRSPRGIVVHSSASGSRARFWVFPGRHGVNGARPKRGPPDRHLITGAAIGNIGSRDDGGDVGRAGSAAAGILAAMAVVMVASWPSAARSSRRLTSCVYPLAPVVCQQPGEERCDNDVRRRNKSAPPARRMSRIHLTSVETATHEYGNVKEGRRASTRRRAASGTAPPSSLGHQRDPSADPAH